MKPSVRFAIGVLIDVNSALEWTFEERSRALEDKYRPFVDAGPWPGLLYGESDPLAVTWPGIPSAVPDGA